MFFFIGKTFLILFIVNIVFSISRSVFLHSVSFLLSAAESVAPVLESSDLEEIMPAASVRYIFL